MKRHSHIVAYLTAFCFVVAAVFPPQAYAISASDEEKLGQEFMQLVYRYYKIVDDPFIQSYISYLGEKIVKVLPPQPFPYRFYVIDEEVYNAFAAPAGHIFINSGLFAALENEEELAGILAHEAAHAHCRHISQNIERSKRLSLVSLAGIVAGVLLGLAGAGGAAVQAATVGTMAAGQSAQLAYSRENERQADEIGLKYLASAGYGGMGLLTSLDKIRSKTWWNKDQIPTYLQTHPAAEDRIAYIDSWLQLYGSAPEGSANSKAGPVDSKNFHRARNRLIALYGNEDVALRHYRQAVVDQPNNPMSRYGYGLTLGRVGRRAEAIEQLRLALAKQAFDPYILKDLGRIYFLDGNYSDALRTLEGAEAMGASDPEAPFYRGRTLMEMGRLDEALPIFQDTVLRYQGYLPALFYLGSVYGELGNLGEAHFNLGLYYAEKMDYRTAQMQFEKALSQTSDPDRKSEIENYLRRLRRQNQKASEEEAEGKG